MANKHIIVRIKLKDKADVDEVIMEMDYSFTHDDIIETEIVGFADDELKWE